MYVRHQKRTSDDKDLTLSSQNSQVKKRSLEKVTFLPTLISFI